MIARLASSSESQFAQQDPLPADSHIHKIKSELNRRRVALIELAHRSDSNMPANDRWEIREYLERWSLPKRPDSIPELMRSFITSCFSYAVIRSYCESIIGNIPTRTEGDCLRAFLSAVGLNFHKQLRHAANFLRKFFWWLLFYQKKMTFNVIAV